MDPCLRKGLSEPTVTGSKKANKELKRRKIECKLHQRLSQYYPVSKEKEKEEEKGKRKRKRKEKKEWECPPLLAKGEHGHGRSSY